MKLIHEDEIWKNIQKAGAVQRAMTWFQSVLSELLGFVYQMFDLFIKEGLTSLEWSDILDLPRRLPEDRLGLRQLPGQFHLLGRRQGVGLAADRFLKSSRPR